MHIHIPYFNYMKYSRKGLYFSVVVLILSLLIMLFRGFNLGLEFTGGATLDLEFAQTADITAIRDEALKYHPNANVIQYGSSREVQISFGEIKDKNTDTLMTEIFSGIKQKYPDVKLNSQSKVGGQYRAELVEKGITALILSCIGMVLYLSLRFEWKFSIGAVIAQIHDVLITAAIFALMGWTFDLTVLAALLAILGYSVNDTVVLYDRVRENIRLMSNKKIDEIINLSIQQTMSRTIITSLTTMFAVVALLFLGGSSLFGFSVAMVFGIIIGTYSSIFVATSLVKEMNLQAEDLLPKQRKQIDDLP